MATDKQGKAAFIQMSWKIHHQSLDLQCTGSPLLQRVRFVNIVCKEKES